MLSYVCFWRRQTNNGIGASAATIDNVGVSVKKRVWHVAASKQ